MIYKSNFYAQVTHRIIDWMSYQRLSCFQFLRNKGKTVHHKLTAACCLYDSLKPSTNLWNFQVRSSHYETTIDSQDCRSSKFQ